MFKVRPWHQMIAPLLLLAALIIYISFPLGRMYWPYMLSAYWMALFAYMREVKELPPGEKLPVLRYLFPKDVWLHQSSLNDGILFWVNFALFNWLLGYFFIGFGSNDFGAWTRSILNYIHAENLKASSSPGDFIIGLYVISAMLLSELFFYINHRLQHTHPVLWEFHKVHHSAKVMTPLTATRVHPFVCLLDMIARHLGVGLSSGLFIYIYPSATSVSIVAATVIVFSALNVLGANLHHSHIWMRFPAMIERFVTSPALHQIHHSDKAKHHGKNYGTILTFWDWVFGTLYIPQGKEIITFGLGNSKHEDPYQSIRGLFVHPIKQTKKRIFRKKRIAVAKAREASLYSSLGPGERS